MSEKMGGNIPGGNFPDTYLLVKKKLIKNSVHKLYKVYINS